MHSSKSDPPLSEPTLLVLAALWTGPQHGYAIRQSVLDLCPDRVGLGNGTLYECLGRLEAQGWIEEIAQEKASRRRCRTFALTQQGKNLLRREARRLVTLVQLCRDLRVLD